MRDDSAHLAEGARWMSTNDDADLRSRLETLDPRARDVLRRVLIREPGRPRRDRPTFLERRRSHRPGYDIKGVSARASFAPSAVRSSLSGRPLRTIRLSQIPASTEVTIESITSDAKKDRLTIPAPKAVDARTMPGPPRAFMAAARLSAVG